LFLVVDNSQSVLDFDVETAQKLYEQSFVSLLYHELWENIKHDIKSMISSDLFTNDGNIKIKITKCESQVTQTAHPNESPHPTTLIFGSYSFEIDPLFTKTFPRLGLCDIVLININLQGQHRSFFGVVVHVIDNWPPHMDKDAVTSLKECNENKHIIQVKSDVVLYTSKKCLDAVAKHCGSVRPQTVSVLKLTNITSSRRHISAIYNFHTFSKQRNLLKPSNTDEYFYYDNLPNDLQVNGNFNHDQMQVIKFAQRIFDDNTNNRLHLVHGPPGLM